MCQFFKYIYNVIRVIVIGIRDILIAIYITFLGLLFIAFFVAALIIGLLMMPFVKADWFNKVINKWQRRS